jgi:hypothetical protein
MMAIGVSCGISHRLFSFAMLLILLTYSVFSWLPFSCVKFADQSNLLIVIRSREVSYLLRKAPFSALNVGTNNDVPM